MREAGARGEEPTRGVAVEGERRSDVQADLVPANNLDAGNLASLASIEKLVRSKQK